MNKRIIFILLLIILLFINTETIFASFSFSKSGGFNQIFSGRILNTKAIEIQALESAGFICVTPGTSISITPIGAPFYTPISYLIPFSVVSKTGVTPAPGQLIIGKYFGKMISTCTSPTIPPIITTIPLDTIIIFGNSRR